MNYNNEKENMIIVKIDLNEKRIGTKPLSPDFFLNLVREKISNKTKNESYQFLDKNGNKIEIEQENLFKLSNILLDNNIIKLEKTKDKLKLRVILNNSQEYTIFSYENETLNNLRESLNELINQNFFFLDGDENEVEIEDEIYYKLDDILNKESKDLIKIMSSTYKDAPPITLDKPKDMQKFNTPTSYEAISKKKELKYYKYFDPTPIKKHYIVLHNCEQSNNIPNQIDVNKEKINEKSKKMNVLDKCDFFGFKNELKIYKYSIPKAQNPFQNVYLYYYDKFDMEFDEVISCVILFCGKTGDGKTTAINALFNIIKGVNIDDNYRVILIDEKQKPKKGESQKDNINLYFIKDYEDKPIIIIDSPGYGDTRGIQYDQKTTETFNYVFRI